MTSYVAAHLNVVIIRQIDGPIIYLRICLNKILSGFFRSNANK